MWMTHYWKRSVEKDQIENTKQSLNEQHNNIQFTYEKEHNYKINFLNMTIFRDNNKLFTNWYKKSFASSRLINWYSAHSRTITLNTAIRFIKTIVELSDAIFFETNKEIIIRTLKLNCFPEDKIITLMNEHYTYMKPPNNRITNENFVFNINTDNHNNLGQKEFSNFWYNRNKNSTNSSTITNNNNKNIAKYLPFPHIHPKYKEIKHILSHNLKEEYKLTNSYTNNKINLIKNIKDKESNDHKTNAIMQFECQCRKHVKIETTKINETIQMLVNKHTSTFGLCTNIKHIYNKYKVIRGLNNRKLTETYTTHIQWKHRKQIQDQTTISFPISEFRNM